MGTMSMSYLNRRREIVLDSHGLPPPAERPGELHDS